MHTFTQHHIQQNHAHLRVRSLLLDAPQAQVVVQQWMQAPHGELIAAHIQQRMRRALQCIRQLLAFVHGRIGEERLQRCLQHKHGFISKRATGE